MLQRIIFRLFRDHSPLPTRLLQSSIHYRSNLGVSRAGLHFSHPFNILRLPVLFTKRDLESRELAIIIYSERFER
jgi:hypothetical protein